MEVNGDRQLFGDHIVNGNSTNIWRVSVSKQFMVAIDFHSME